MTFLAPAHAFWLLVLPVLYWLSLPSRPRTQTWTPHLAQWQLALSALRWRPPRLARWRFLLLALAAIAAVLAFAQPVLVATSGPTRLVVVLDASASMAAVDAAGISAWSRAKALLQRTFANVPPHVDVTLLRAGGPMVRRHGASARALQDLGEPSGELAIDLSALATAIENDAQTAVWTLSDGQGSASLPTAGGLTVLDGSGSNGAVLAARLQDRWPLPGFSLVVEVVAFADSQITGELRIEGAASDTRAVELPHGVVRNETFELTRAAAGGPLRVELVVAGDHLAADNTWSVWLPPLPAPRIAVLVDGEAGPFADAAANALAKEVHGTVVAAAAGSEASLLLVDGGQAALGAGRVRALTFGAALAGGVAPTLWRSPTVADWDRLSPLTMGLDLSELRIQQAWRSLLPSGEAFLWADDGAGREPLAVVVGAGDVASVHFAFRLQDSNLPLLPAFPQLLRRAFVRSYGAGAAPVVQSRPVAAGEQNLLAAARASDRALPTFGGEARDLSPWFLVVGLCALALRAFVR